MAGRSLVETGDRMVKVLWAWRRFKDSHDVHGVRHRCCTHTVALFEALDSLDSLFPESEAEVRELPKIDLEDLGWAGRTMDRLTRRGERVTRSEDSRELDDARDAWRVIRPLVRHFFDHDFGT